MSRSGRLAILLSSAALGACPGPNGERPACEADGGGPQIATPRFEAFLAQLPGCSIDSDCVLVQTPCKQSYRDCGFSEAPVLRAQESAAEQLASQLTAELCPQSCSTTEFDAPIGGNGECDLDFDATPTAVCLLTTADAGVCGVASEQDVDAGAGHFEQLCDFSCGPGEFCDIEALETACDAGPGIFAVSTSGQGTCAQITSLSTNCVDDQDCGFGQVCAGPGGPSPCTTASGACTCIAACPAAQPTCPAGCAGPVNDGRHCEICDCVACL